MIKSKIGFEYVGTIDIWHVYLLGARGLKRLLMVNSTDGRTLAPEDLIERKDLCEVDYAIMKDIFNHLWNGQGANDMEKFKDIKWDTLKRKPEPYEVEAFANRFDLVKEFDEAFTQVSVTIISRFNLDQMHFLDENI